MIMLQMENVLLLHTIAMKMPNPFHEEHLKILLFLSSIESGLFLTKTISYFFSVFTFVECCVLLIYLLSIIPDRFKILTTAITNTGEHV